jgi:hypothetical protein
MTRAEASAVREKWQQQVAPPACEHPNQELEVSEEGYLTGNYHCRTCGVPVAKKL